MSLTNRARDKTQDPLDEPVHSDPLRRASGVQARAQRQELAPPATNAARTLPLISIGAPADPTLLEPTYAYLSVYCAASFPPRVADRLNVALYELYANALRYGTTASEVRLELERDERGARLRISNSAEPANLTRLQEQIARVHAGAQAAFDAEMARFGGQSEVQPMLGIVRVAHESQLWLELELAGARVTVTTRCDA
jgi:hypothetical protein